MAPSITGDTKTPPSERAPKSRFSREFPHTETDPYVRSAAMSRHFADSVRVRDGLAGWGDGIRTSASRNQICFILPEQDLGVDRAPELFVRSALEHL